MNHHRSAKRFLLWLNCVLEGNKRQQVVFNDLRQSVVDWTWCFEGSKVSHYGRLILLVPIKRLFFLFARSLATSKMSLNRWKIENQLRRSFKWHQGRQLRFIFILLLEHTTFFKRENENLKSETFSVPILIIRLKTTNNCEDFSNWIFGFFFLVFRLSSHFISRHVSWVVTKKFIVGGFVINFWRFLNNKILILTYLTSNIIFEFMSGSKPVNLNFQMLIFTIFYLKKLQ